jgi:hypothetical protein
LHPHPFEISGEFQTISQKSRFEEFRNYLSCAEELLSSLV